MKHWIKTDLVQGWILYIERQQAWKAIYKLVQTFGELKA